MAVGTGHVCRGQMQLLCNPSDDTPASHETATVIDIRNLLEMPEWQRFVMSEGFNARRGNCVLSLSL